MNSGSLSPPGSEPGTRRLRSFYRGAPCSDLGSRRSCGPVNSRCSRRAQASPRRISDQIMVRNSQLRQYAVARTNRRANPLHRTRKPLGKRFLRKLQRQVQRRSAGQGDPLHFRGGAGHHRAPVQAVHTFRPHSSARYSPPAPVALPRTHVVQSRPKMIWYPTGARTQESLT